ncbi:uncharacterized protein BXZ73DRAFT_102868 [Epithele typhae]|uniref:uncharacterized protein n=1 Tax=Epithele typhae TaxID=378194 RepID=UPI002008DEF9|nr:uncharacterized protein BXZ73DRAFT_102868 [Epithele typhae]KAH9926609.1 hypothetical protein BXZ73DRAFT_102868 [Epithele typhae]
MDPLTSDEVTTALRAMGVDIEPIPQERRKYLRLALDTCQHGLRRAPFPNLANLPTWPKSTPVSYKARRNYHYTHRPLSARLTHDPTSLVQASERGGPKQCNSWGRDEAAGRRRRRASSGRWHKVGGLRGTRRPARA